jgi:hypothetical protein
MTADYLCWDEGTCKDDGWVINSPGPKDAALEYANRKANYDGYSEVDKLSICVVGPEPRTYVFVALVKLEPVLYVEQAA